jgi:putative mRNA 3-end processing factor
MSDHADWPGLMSAIAGTGAQHIRVTHGSVPVLVRWLTEQGLDAQAFETEYGADDVSDVAAGSETSAPNTPGIHAGPAEAILLQAQLPAAPGEEDPRAPEGGAR